MLGTLGSNYSKVVHDWDIAAHLPDGSAVQMLPQYCQPAYVWAVTSSPSDSAKIRVCIEFLNQHLKQGAQVTGPLVSPRHQANVAGFFS